MKKMILTFVSILLLLSAACEKLPESAADPSVSLLEQTVAQLGVETEDTERVPLNYEKQSGMWFTYMDIENILKGKNESEFTESVRKCIENAKNLGINTLYIHVRAFGESLCRSELFPVMETTGGFDPFEIMLEEAHEYGISVHGWINPLRCQTEEQLKKLDDRYIIKKWYREKNGTYIVKCGENYYLNPAYAEVRKLVAESAAEIAENYSVDGLHIDDYFYPVTDREFDLAAFEESGAEELEMWRISNINSLVKEIYTAVKTTDKRLLFGISPQGNTELNYTMRYADVKNWASGEGYCDYIVPQIYYGFENESCPFEKTSEEWRNMNRGSGVKLVIGICTYKIGKEDKWAGSGKNEWLEKSCIPARQAEYCSENGTGIAVYSYGSVFGENEKEEREALSAAIKKGYGGEET